MEQANRFTVLEVSMDLGTLYTKYLKEREDTNIISIDVGFVTYRFESDFCYIIDVYVLPEHRKSGKCVELESLVINEAVKAGYNVLLGSVDKSANGWEGSMKMMKATGYREASVIDSMVYFIKEIV